MYNIINVDPIYIIYNIGQTCIMYNIINVYTIYYV